MSASPPHTLELLTAATPNGQKISIFLAELGLPYTLTPVSLSNSEQKSPAFLSRANPNGRIPALVDHSRGGSKGFRVFESGAILLYLAERYDGENAFSFRFGEGEDQGEERSEMLQWLFFQNAGVGPMQGQANHFYRYAPEKIPYAVERYQNETRRLYSVLEERLKGRDYLVGKGVGRYSIADISTVSFCWGTFTSCLFFFAGREADKMAVYVGALGAVGRHRSRPLPCAESLGGPDRGARRGAGGARGAGWRGPDREVEAESRCRGSIQGLGHAGAERVERAAWEIKSGI